MSVIHQSPVYAVTAGEGDGPDAAALAADLGGTPALKYATAVAAGVATSFLRTDDTVLFPSALMSSANLSTLTLTDDAVDQTLTGSLGTLNLRSAARTASLPLYSSAGETNPTTGIVLGFTLTTSTTGDDLLRTGVQSTVGWTRSGGTYSSVNLIGVSSTAQIGTGPTFTNATIIGAQISAPGATLSTGTNTFTKRSALELAIGAPVGANAGTTTDHFGLRISGWPAIGTAGTYTNANAISAHLPTIGGTQRRGIVVTTTTGNVGTDPASCEGFYCEDLTRGTTERGSFCFEGATTGTPTSVYGILQETAHVVGTNRYGAKVLGATTGTPTNCYGYYSDNHAVGTNRWSYWGSNKFHCDTSDFIANASGFGFSNRDSQSSSAGGGGTARYWRIYTDASATGVAGDVTINIDSLGVMTATRAGGATGTVQIILKDVGTAPVAT